MCVQVKFDIRRQNLCAVEVVRTRIHQKKEHSRFTDFFECVDDGFQELALFPVGDVPFLEPSLNVGFR